MALDISSVEQRLNTALVGRRIVYLSSVSSSQDVARAEAEGGAEEGTVVIADEQTAGRGRLGRAWVSPPGQNLYLTIILRPGVDRLQSLGMVAPLATAQAVEKVTGLQAMLKWPNDVLLNGRKLAGVLIDSEFAGEKLKYSLVGLGLNVNLDVDSEPDLSSIATSLKRELNREVSREATMAALLNSFEALYLKPDQGAEVYHAWKARLETIGRDVRVRFGGTVEEGVAEDVDEEGSLILRRADGSRATILAGEVTLRA